MEGLLAKVFIACFLLGMNSRVTDSGPTGTRSVTQQLPRTQTVKQSNFYGTTRIGSVVSATKYVKTNAIATTPAKSTVSKTSRVANPANTMTMDQLQKYINMLTAEGPDAIPKSVEEQKCLEAFRNAIKKELTKALVAAITKLVVDYPKTHPPKNITKTTIRAVE